MAISKFLKNMVSIPAGTYIKGQGSREWNAARTTVSSDFSLAQVPVTQKVWTAVMGSCPWKTEKTYWNSRFEPDEDGITTADLPHFVEGDNLPAVGISWHDAVSFAEKLSCITGRNFRLPSAVEWEYAYRAGSTTECFWGDYNDEEEEERIYATAKQFAWFSLNSEDRIRPVGKLSPNPWGLYDMAGNVAEWVLDACPADKFPTLPPDFFPNDSIDFISKEGELRFACGGDFDSFGRLSASFLNAYIPDYRSVAVGFRILEKF